MKCGKFVYNKFFWYFLIIFLHKNKVNGDNVKEISIGFLIDSIQSHIKSEISTILNEIELNENFKIKANYVTIDYDNKDESIIQAEVCKTISEPKSLLIDLSYYPWDDVLQYIRLSKIPYLRVDITINQFLNVLENYLIVREAHDACLIFQSEYDLEDAIYYMVTKNVELRLGLLNGMEMDFIEKLKNMRPSPSYYGIFATTENMNKITEKLYQSKILKLPDKWHLVFLDANDENFKNENYDEKITKITIEKKFACKFSKNSNNCNLPELFSKATLKEVLLKTITQLDNLNFKPSSFNCDEHTIESFESSSDLTDLSHLFNNDIKLKNENGTVTYFLNLQISTLKQNNENSNILASWDSNQLVNVSAVVRPARRFFRIGTTEAIPWSYYKRDPKTNELILDVNSNPIWEGYCIDFIKKLSEKLNFDYEIISPKRGSFGEKQTDGSWDGIVGDLVYGYTDIAVTSLKMTSEREEVIDFIAPYFEQTGISIVIRKPVRQTSLFKFMTVLRTEVWFSIVAALIATAIMIWFLDKYSPYSAANNKKAYSYPCRNFSLKESFWFALTSFTPQGGGEAPKAISGRVLVAAYWLFVVLMLATFTANLAAFLTVERMQTPVQSLEQLARQSRINYTVVMNSDTHEYFINMKHAEDTLYRMWKELTLNATADQRKYRIWDYPIKEQYGHILLAINSSNPVKNAKEGFRKVNEHENADYAFIHDSAEIKYEITKNCNLTEVGEIFAEQPYAIAVQQGSHIQDEISYAILELQKDRYFESLNAKFWNSSTTKECSASEENEGITLESLGGVFIATLIGLALAMITLAIEVVYYRNKAKKLGKIRLVKPAVIEKNIFGKKVNISPPPSFEKAVLDSKKIPHHITFGSENFKPARLRNTGTLMSISSRNPIRFEDIPPYYE